MRPPSLFFLLYFRYTEIATVILKKTNPPGYNGSQLKTEALSDSALKTMYNYSVMIPAVLFLLVWVLLRFVYPLSKKRVTELQVQKERLFGKE